MRLAQHSRITACDDCAMLIDAAASLDRLVLLTGPGKPVAPVVAELESVAGTIRAQLPAVEQARAGAAFVDDLARIANAAGQLGDSLQELADVDGMTDFDAAFAADDPGWDSWFASSAQLVRDAGQAIRSTASV